jgi:hypothetical protein
MGKNQQAAQAKNNISAGNQLGTQAQQDYTNFRTGVQATGSDQFAKAGSDYAGAKSGYNDFAETGGIDPALQAQLLALYSGGGPGGVGNPLAGKSSSFAGLSSAANNIVGPNYGQADSIYSGLGGAGCGFDPTALKQIYANQGQLSDIGKTGGITPGDVSGIDRQSLLDMESTGGYTPDQLANARRAASSNAPTFFANLKQQLDRGRNITGNLAGTGATDFKAARAAAQQSGQDRLNSALAIQKDINANKMAAGGKLSDQNLSLTGLRTGNQLAGLTGALSSANDTQRTITGNQLAAAGGLSSNQTNLGQFGLSKAGLLDNFGLTQAGGLDQFTGQQAQMQLSADEANSSAQNAYRAQQAGILGDLISGKQSGREYGISGLSGLYNTNLAAGQKSQGMDYNALNDYYNQRVNILQNQTQNTAGLKKGFNWGQAAKIAAAAAATYFTGGAAAPLLAGTISPESDDGNG